MFFRRCASRLKSFEQTNFVHMSPVVLHLLGSFHFIKMDSKKLILEIYKAVINETVEISHVYNRWSNDLILHFEAKEGSKLNEIFIGVKELMKEERRKEFELEVQNKPKEIDNQKSRLQEKKKTYILVNKANNKYKIGESINPEGRKITLRSEEPEIELLFFCHSSIVSEKELHAIFENKRHIGEWFNLDKKDIIRIKKMMQL